MSPTVHTAEFEELPSGLISVPVQVGDGTGNVHRFTRYKQDPTPKYRVTGNCPKHIPGLHVKIVAVQKFLAELYAHQYIRGMQPLIESQIVGLAHARSWLFGNDMSFTIEEGIERLLRTEPLLFTREKLPELGDEVVLTPHRTWLTKGYIA